MKTLYLLFILLLLSCGKLYASIERDLLQHISTLPDSTKSDTLLHWVSLNYREKPDDCLTLLSVVIEHSTKQNNAKNLSRAYSLSGVIYKNKGEFSEALDFHHKSLKINDSIGLKNALATNYNDIGIIYKTMGEYHKALESYLLANSLATELNLKRGIVMTLNNIGTIYEALNNPNEAIAYYNRSYRKAIEFGIRDAEAIALNNLGEVYANKGDGKTARRYFKETLAIDSETGDKIGSVYSMLNIAATYIGQRNWDSARYFYQKSDAIAKELNARQLLINVWAGYTRLFEEKGDFKQALEASRLREKYQDSVYNESNSLRIAEIEARFDAQKKDHEIDMLKQEMLLNELKIRQHRADLIAVTTILLMGSILIFFFYKRYRARQQYLFDQKLLRQKEAHLAAIVETQEQERKRIAKDLHDGVGQVLSGVRLGMNQLVDVIQTDEKHKVKLKELSTVIDSACTEVRSISHQMMPRILQEDGLIPALADMLDKTFRITEIQYDFEHYGIESRFKESIEIGLYRITQELVNNIVKHSGATKVNVQLFKASGILVLLVEDNGKGFKMNIGKDKGIGLMNISSRVETIHGEFNLEPSPESGTLATIRIPIE